MNDLAKHRFYLKSKLNWMESKRIKTDQEQRFPRPDLFKPFESTELIRAIESRLKKNELLKKEYSNNAQGVHDFLNEAKNILSLEDLTKEAHQFSYAAKETIFKEGEHVHFVYYLEEGQVKTYRFNDDGKEYITSIFNEGDFFGYQPVFEDRTYNEIAEAIRDSKLLKIAKDDFLALMFQNREVAKKFMTLISKNLSDKEEELMHMAYSSVRKRVSKKLQELLGDNNEITILRSDLAKLTGTTKETLTRTITEFKQSDIIKTEGKKIVLIDRKKLQKMDLIW